jgi:hypothetical protein
MRNHDFWQTIVKRIILILFATVFAWESFCVIFEIFIAMTMKKVVFWDVVLVDLMWTGVSEEFFASIFREQKSLATCSPWFLLRGIFFLKMETISFSDTSVHTRSTRRHILEYVGPLSLRHGASSGCGWRRRPTVLEGSCEYIE